MRVKGRHLRKMKIATAATANSALRKNSINEALVMCEAVLDYAKELEARVAENDERMNEFETLQRAFSELRQHVSASQVPEIIIFGARTVRPRYWHI